jgi:hypothetical protein
MELEVSADASGVTAVNWIRTQRWAWDEIDSFDYARAPFVRLYKGRVVLRSGKTHALSALVGSRSGNGEADTRPRWFVEQLGLALATSRT